VPVVPEPVALDVPGTVRMGPHLLAARPATGPDKGHLSYDRARIVATNALVVRPPSPGDRIEVADGSKKVSDVLNEAGIPVRKRFAWPVVETHARIAWVAGARVAFWARDEESPGMWVELERRTL
jgi:tRNA(Ile)-lysidine synthetase-like protein